ncbi:MAG TPA: DUF4127 family protein [bacterium]|nr:DUF4127 family protein [bacterium]
MKLLFIPLDDRPATRDAVMDLAAAGGIEVITPARATLGGRDRGADVPALWTWLHGELQGDAPAACIASAEMLCFGGLVAARRSTRHWRNLLPWLDEIHTLAARVPTYLSAVIPRTPTSGGGAEDPLYWETHGDALREYAAAADRFAWMGDPASRRGLAETLAKLPSEVVEDLFQHRRRHLLINAELLIAAAQGRLRSLLIGQDDTTATGLSRMDREALDRLAARTSSLEAGTPRVLLTSGADELGATLFARWLNDAAATSPAVRIAYTVPDARESVAAYESTPLLQSVRDHVVASGCRIVDDGEDILLWVHNFAEERQREARDQPDPRQDTRGAAAAEALVKATESDERVVAVADVRYANGADRAFVEALLRQTGFGGVHAYAAWNTAGNALGSAVAQAVTVLHVQRGTVPGSLDAARQILITRLLDDWGYQAVVRLRLSRLVAERGGDVADVGDLEPALETAAIAFFAEEVVPLLSSSFDHRITVHQVAFPWRRLFEVLIEFEIAAIHV